MMPTKVLLFMVNKFSFLKEGLPSLKTACAPCMLETQFG